MNTDRCVITACYRIPQPNSCYCDKHQETLLTVVHRYPTHDAAQTDATVLEKYGIRVTVAESFVDHPAGTSPEWEVAAHIPPMPALANMLARVYRDPEPDYQSRIGSTQWDED